MWLVTTVLCGYGTISISSARKLKTSTSIYPFIFIHTSTYVIYKIFLKKIHYVYVCVSVWICTCVWVLTKGKGIRLPWSWNHKWFSATSGAGNWTWPLWGQYILFLTCFCLCMYVCMYAHWCFACIYVSVRGSDDSLELELQIVVHHRVDGRNGTWVLWKDS